jgi:tetratricopeptide (TPR) repeat protein
MELGELEVGERLGRFIVLRLVGGGGMGDVYEARDPELGRSVALKVLATGVESGEEDRLRLSREAQALAQLDHPNVVAVHDVGVQGDRLFVAMDYIDGETLAGTLRARRHTRGEILALFVQAGRGLAAAHARHIVHRDFKPSNVLVDGEGRVRVMDFGLARMVPPGGELAEGSLPPLDRSPTPAPLSSPVTVASTTIGTPRYMSPEQQARRPVTARSDQYSFCLALWEALAGELAPGGARRIPSWLRAALRKGLAEDPDARHASMAALLDLLEGTPRRRRRLAIAAGAVILCAGAAGGTLALARAGLIGIERDGCDGFEGRLAGIWDATTRGAVEAAFRASGRPYAGESFRLAAEGLDAWSRSWVEARRRTCETRADQSAELHDLRVACLDERRDELAAVTRVLAAASGDGVDSAPRAAAGLASLAACDDAAALRAAVPLPADAARRAEILALRARVLDADAVYKGGRPKDGAALAAAQLDPVRATGHAPLIAHALHVRGTALREAGEPAEAEATLREALRHAAAARDDRRLARIWTYLIIVVGSDLGRLDEGLAIAEVARVATVRAGDEDLQRAYTARHTGMLRRMKGDLAGAVAALSEAVDLSDRIGDTGGEAHGALNLGLAFHDAGRLLESEAQMLRSAALYARAYGASHPAVASPLENLARVLIDQGGRDAEARAHMVRVLEIKQGSLGPEHRRLASTWATIGLLEARTGQADAARASCDRALKIAEKLPAGGRGRLNLDCGIALLALGDRAAARPLLEHAVESLGARRGKEDPQVIEARRLLEQARGP